MKNLCAISALAMFLIACGGGEKASEADAAKASRNQASAQECEAGLTRSGNLCVAKPAPSSVALETM